MAARILYYTWTFHWCSILMFHQIIIMFLNIRWTFLCNDMIFKIHAWIQMRNSWLIHIMISSLCESFSLSSMYHVYDRKCITEPTCYRNFKCQGYRGRNNQDVTSTADTNYLFTSGRRIFFVALTNASEWTLFSVHSSPTFLYIHHTDIFT